MWLNDHVRALGTCAKPASLVAVLLFVAWVVILATPGGFIFVPMMLLPLSALIGVCMLSLFWRRYRTPAAAGLAGIAVAFSLAALPTPAGSFARWAADLADVVVYRADLHRLSDEERRTGVSPAIGVLAVEGFGSLTSGLALDPSRELGLPPELRSAAWRASADHTELGVDGIETRHIIGDYYGWFHD